MFTFSRLWVFSFVNNRLNEYVNNQKPLVSKEIQNSHP